MGICSANKAQYQLMRALRSVLLYYLILTPCFEEGQCVMCVCVVHIFSINWCLIKLHSKYEALSYSSLGILFTGKWQDQGVWWGPEANLFTWSTDDFIIHHILCFQPALLLTSDAPPKKLIQLYLYVILLIFICIKFTINVCTIHIRCGPVVQYRTTRPKGKEWAPYVTAIFHLIKTISCPVWARTALLLLWALCAAWHHDLMIYYRDGWKYEHSDWK